MPDLYKILQVDPSAEPEVIEAAYKRLVRKYHPDVNGSPDAHTRMQELNDAYAILSDPAQRAEYDQARAWVAFTPPVPRAPISTTRWWIISGMSAIAGLMILLACLLFSGAFVFGRAQPASTATLFTRVERPTFTPAPTLTRTPESTPTRTRTPRPTPRPSPTPTLAPIGLARENPVPLGQSIVWTGREGEQIRFTVLSAYRGDDAQSLLQFANPLPSDWTPLVFKVRAECLNVGRRAFLVLSEFDFRAVAANGKEYPQPDSPPIIPPSPRLGRTLAPGDVGEGWVAMAIRADETDLVLTYGQIIFPNEMRVWLSMH